MTCFECRWWGTPDPTGYARCLLYGHFISGFPELRINVPGDQGAVLVTAADFGCIQAEAKIDPACEEGTPV